MKCNECNETENLMEFRPDTREPNFYLCQECWNEKLSKGIKNHDSFVCRCKELRSNKQK